ncbi:NAD-dependent epimerase/dehydratase family protein [Sessilibacter corallicola]|uniref:NAD-dependent epimerase/dehydratase family protein n=1 Tax=Sessilibacter corallicola TaxID=2904075 RepID=A0ABQ0A4U9_9GAMM
MTQINRSAPVMVTGATGYVAGHLVKKLLDAGLTVHAPVRNPENVQKLKYLNAIAENSPGAIRYFEADLLKPHSYAQAMEGCELVYHTASPFKLNIRDPQKELIDPALLGTRNVLQQANHIESVKRIIVTSSCAAIYGDNCDLVKTANGVFTEDDWNQSSSIDHNPYSYSKTVAEREAWKIADQQSQWDLITINPSLVIGPGINPHATSESYNILKQMGNGTMKFGAPKLGLGAIDVRDLADAHFAAGFYPKAKGRYIVSAHNTDLFELTQTLIDRFGDDYPLPKKPIPKWLAWLFGPILDKSVTRKLVARNVNYSWRADNKKALKELNISYRPLKETMRDFFQHGIDNNLFNA